jgi:hypothetical protein
MLLASPQFTRQLIVSHNTAFHIVRVISHRCFRDAFSGYKQLDIVKDVSASLMPCWIDSTPDSLAFHQREEAFGDGIVPAVSSTAHAGL